MSKDGYLGGRGGSEFTVNEAGRGQEVLGVEGEDVEIVKDEVCWASQLVTYEEEVGEVIDEDCDTVEEEVEVEDDEETEEEGGEEERTDTGEWGGQRGERREVTMALALLLLRPGGLL